MQQTYARKNHSNVPKHQDTKRYVYNASSQRARVTQAFKEFQFGKISQQTLGLILAEIGEKLQRTQPQVEQMPLNE